MEEKRDGDDAQLAGLGHRAELQRNFSTLYVCYPGEREGRGRGRGHRLTTAGRCWVWHLRF